VSPEKKRVLYLAHGHPRFSPGGAEWAAYYLYNAMKALDCYEPFFLARLDDPTNVLIRPGCRLACDSEDPRTHFFITQGSQYDYFYQALADSQLGNPEIYESIKTFLLGVRPDVVHVQHYVHLGMDILPLIRDVLPKAKIILTLHEYTLCCARDGTLLKTNGNQLCDKPTLPGCSRCRGGRTPEEFFLRDRLFRKNIAAVDHFIAPSQFLKDRHVEWGIPAGNITVLDNGRPIWPPPPARSRPSDTPFRVSFFGQLVFHKGWDVFLKAAAEYENLQKESAGKLPNVRFSLHGTRDHLPAELTAKLDSLIETAGSALHVHGPYEMQQMPSLLDQSDCVVVPSIWWENSPLVIQEAFMARRPIICSNIGGMAEKVAHDVNGLHFSVGNHFELLDRILELARNPELYRRLQEGIPDILSDRDMALEVLKLYDGLPLDAEARRPDNSTAEVQ
jgi:glycosyltransferase involved in cell wall biosynthesis